MNRLQLWFSNLGFALANALVYPFLPDRSAGRDPADKPYLLIVGVELDNRHSVAKILRFVRQAQVEFPGKKVVLLSRAETWQQGEVGWPLKVLPWEVGTRVRLLTPFCKRFYQPSPFDEAVIREHAEDAALMVDLGDDQLDARRGAEATLHCLANLVFARRFGIPFYFLPQSVSPFFGALSRPWLLKTVLNGMLRSLPGSARALCIREDWGLAAFAKRSKAPATRCLDYLLYGDLPLVGEGGWVGTPSSLVLVPDSVLWRDEAWFLSLVTTLATSNAAKFGRLIVYAPESDSAAWAEEHREWLPAPWTIRLAPDLHRPEEFLTSRRDAVVVTADYGTLISGLLCGRPAVALAFDSPARSLYLAMGLETLLVDPRGIDPAAAVTRALVQLTARGRELSDRALCKTRELTLRHPLPKVVLS